ncbi:MAG: hypothetical protein H6834_16095 [Planctomycetes bacterium]|nr:hypothetical protein [Planctomycetota bacterium]
MRAPHVFRSEERARLEHPALRSAQATTTLAANPDHLLVDLIVTDLPEEVVPEAQVKERRG